MKQTLLLFKKDFLSAASPFRRDKQKRDLFGTLSTVVLLLGIYAVFIYVLHEFAKMYLSVTFTSPAAEAERVYELMTCVFGIVFFLNVLVGVRRIYANLCESADFDVLMCQPIGARTIFFYKLAKVYLAQVLSSFIVLLPAAIIADVLSGYTGGAGYYFALLLTIVLTPLLSCAVASVLSVPYTAVMRFVDSRFVLHLILYVAIIITGFYVYSLFLGLLSGLLQSGEIKYVFDRNTINEISRVTALLFPCNLLADTLLGREVWQSILIILAISLCAGGLTFIVVQKIYLAVQQRKMENSVKVYRNKGGYKKRSITKTLLYKEFLVVLRTPSYAFQYLATSVTLPFMVYVCVNLMRSLMSSVTILDCDYELSVFVISMFSVLGNTFCTTNISRDGKMSAMLKTLPVKPRDLVKSKLLFCGLVSVVSVLTSCIILLSVGFLSAWQAIFVFFIGMLVSLAEIAAATRKDLNTPNFPESDNDEVTDSNSNVSTIVLIGLFVSLLAGVGSLAITTIISLTSALSRAYLFATGFVAVVAIIAFVLSFVYLFRGLDKKYFTNEN